MNPHAIPGSEDGVMDSKLQEIMLKNIWEIENNPVFNTLSSTHSHYNLQTTSEVIGGQMHV